MRVSAAAPRGEGGFDLAVATTDLAGALAILDAPAGSATLTIDAPGFAALDLELAAGDVRERLVPLAPATSLSGKVVQDGRPIAGAAVAVGLRRARSDADGRFTLDGVGDRPAMLEAVLGVLLATLRVPARPGAELALALAPGARLIGRVIDGRTTHALSGAWVRILRMMSSGGVTFSVRESDGLVDDELLTRTQGMFVVRTLRAGTIRIQVARPGYAPRNVNLELSGGRTSTVRIALDPLLDVHGRALDHVGRPVAGASVQALPAASADVQHEPVVTTTDASGRFALALPPNAATHVMIRAADLRGELTIPAGDPRPVTITAEPAAHARGRLVDGAGTPIHGGLVTILSSGLGKVPTVHSSTTGEFDFPGLVPSDYLLHIERPGFATIGAGPFKVRRGRAELGTFMLHPSIPIAGIVVQRGQLVAGADVTAHGNFGSTSAVTDANGAFVVDGFGRDAKVSLWADTPGAHAPLVEVRAGTFARLSLEARPTRPNK
ncbi:MAG: carboxypeptidase regulatory-like domain-containing protein [Kofleriaceae bacterium]